jgi:hypothetical protein
MSPTGDYLKLSEKAKGFRDQEERIGRFQEAIEELQKDVAAVTRERDEARALIPKKSSLW